AAAVRARMVNVCRLGGLKTDFDLDLHSLKRLDYVGTTFRTRSVAEVREIVRLMRSDLWKAVVSGTIRLPVDRVFELDQAVTAHAYMASNAHFGKIILKPSTTRPVGSCQVASASVPTTRLASSSRCASAALANGITSIAPASSCPVPSISTTTRPAAV